MFLKCFSGTVFNIANNNFFDQMSAALVNIRDFFKNTLKG